MEKSTIETLLFIAILMMCIELWKSFILLMEIAIEKEQITKRYYLIRFTFKLFFVISIIFVAFKIYS